MPELLYVDATTAKNIIQKENPKLDVVTELVRVVRPVGPYVFNRVILYVNMNDMVIIVPTIG